METIPHDGLVRETDLAKGYRVSDDPAEDLMWIPKSLIEDEGDDYVDVPEWWAIREGLV